VNYQLPLRFAFLFTGRGTYGHETLYYWFLRGTRLGNTYLENTVLKNVL